MGGCLAKPKPNEFKKCSKGHLLVLNKKLDAPYKDNTYWCDNCREESKIDEGVWHCSKGCLYDICGSCRKIDDSMPGKKGKKVSKKVKQ